jgi:hypothetical protein
VFNKNCLKRAALALCLSFVTPGAVASEEEPGEEEAHRRHTLGVFLGVTHEGGENHGTIGIEYAYRIKPLWSIGALVERADREKESTLLLGFVTLHPYKGWLLSGGLGRKDPSERRENAARIGIGYEFELAGGWAITPQVSVDFIEDEENEEVVGVGFYKLF